MSDARKAARPGNLWVSISASTEDVISIACERCHPPDAARDETLRREMGTRVEQEKRQDGASGRAERLSLPLSADNVGRGVASAHAAGLEPGAGFANDVPLPSARGPLWCTATAGTSGSPSPAEAADRPASRDPNESAGGIAVGGSVGGSMGGGGNANGRDCGRDTRDG